MKILRYILFPIVPIYFLVTWLRNKFYDWQILKSKKYTLPIICVGNLSVGGTGKTPMIEYLIRLLKDEVKIATLSRGYKRTTDGFIIADKTATAASIGDEPYQFYNKFSNIIVSVDADRQNGISILQRLNAPPEVILLDDAYQHRKVRANLNILLTPYNDLYVNDILLPTGNLREPRSGAKRADVVVITKCPESIADTDKKRIRNLMKLQHHQKLFFSWIRYSDTVKHENGEKSMSYLKDKRLTLVTGIANPQPMLKYLTSLNLNFEHLKFKDHHEFTSSEIKLLKTKEFILTTEKDFMRLSTYFRDRDDLCYLPIELVLDRPDEFNQLIKTVI